LERISQRELARLTGLRPERIARLELGKVEPMLREIVKIAAVLRMELPELAFGPEGSPS
jgi:transcriptional regulator with XRE-family HTH domain